MVSAPQHRLEFSPAVIRKLDAVYEYISQILGAPQTAASTVGGILNHLNILKNNPEIGPLLTSRIAGIPRRFQQTRFLVCGAYIAIYDHVEPTVKVLALYHGSEDIFGRIFREIF